MFTNATKINDYAFFVLDELSTSILISGVINRGNNRSRVCFNCVFSPYKKGVPAPTSILKYNPAI